jgi:hypothetical protein
MWNFHCDAHILLVRKGGIKMPKLNSTTTKAAAITKAQRSLGRITGVRVSERKLEPRITIGFAEKTPKFVASGKHTVIYEK